MSGLRPVPSLIILIVCGLALAGCATYEYSRIDAIYTRDMGPRTALDSISIVPEIEKKIMKIDPDRVTGDDVKETLSQAPAPRIFNIHGGIYPIYLTMENFSEYLIGMGYPEDRIRHPRTGNYSYSGYDSSLQLAGTIAWHYEHEALRPMIVGHSLGGIMAVKILHQFAGRFENEIPVYNPITDDVAERTTIIDPYTGVTIPVVGGMRLSFVGALAAGGWGRIIPNHWDMNAILRTIPDTVVEFSGYYIPGDFWGGDFFGLADASPYHSSSKAKIRNVTLPPGTHHMTAPSTKHLLEDQAIRNWINDEYIPSERPELDRQFESSTTNLLWAADVWHRIKAHWVLELQRLINAKRATRGLTAGRSVSRAPLVSQGCTMHEYAVADADAAESPCHATCAPLPCTVKLAP